MVDVRSRCNTSRGETDLGDFLEKMTVEQRLEVYGHLVRLPCLHSQL